ncbi:MAG: DNA polymerase I [Alphaproteobacteria bacterium MarineAlpha4_Bin2]|nr:MAG: DNA polymerase I [Alphaproteobacteria bacterium MarineAlpha4_Bin2]
MPDKPLKHLYLVDGSGFIFRAFHAIRPLNRPDGTPVNAVFGFTRMLMKLLRDTQADHIAVIFDAARHNFRNEIYPEYKGHRPDAPEELIPQFPLIRKASEAFNLHTIEIEGYEADDIIATYARQAVDAGAHVTIVSSDKDLMQLVNDKIGMFDEMKNRRIGHDEVVERFGVGPEKVVEVQALAGDSVDNVPGVPGIGVKTAAQLINQYGDLETLLARAEEIKQPKRRENLIRHAEKARMSLQLVTLKDDVPVDLPVDELGVPPHDLHTLVPWLTTQGFDAILAELRSTLDEADEQAFDEVFKEAFTDLPTDKRDRALRKTLAAIEASEGVGSLAADAAPDETEYELVIDEETLEKWIVAARKAGVVAVDTETTSLDAMQAELVGLSLSVQPGRACYVPVGHKGANGQGTLHLGSGSEVDEAEPVQISRKRALYLLAPLLEDPSVLKVGQNIKYDTLVLSHYGVGIYPIDDTMLLSFVLDGGRNGHGMDTLAESHLNMATVKYKDVVGSGKKQVTFDYVSLEAARDYAAEDADVTLRLHQTLKPRLVQERMATVYETIERPLVPVVAAMEKEGIGVDPEKLRALSRDFTQRLAGLEAEVHELAGEEFNIGSPKQLGGILFEKMSLPGGKKNKSGGYGTDASVLEDLKAAGHDLPRRVLEWRQIAKLKSTYSDALIAQINPATGRIHTSYSMAGAQTGRLSSTDPNLQNIPVRTEEGRKIRGAFVAREGWKLLSLDYSQIELRVLAHLAGIDALVEAFRDGQDIHAMTASQVFGVPAEGMDPMVRRQAKAINFGIIYGISAFGLARQLSIPRGDAKNYIEAYFEQYPGIRDYMDAAVEQCRKHGLVETMFGRRIHLEQINAKNPMQRNYAERQAINAPIQGSAADIIKRAMIRVPKAITASGLDAHMLLQVHDELLLEAPETQVEQTMEVVKDAMEAATYPALKLKVPLVVEAGIGDDWATAH